MLHKEGASASFKIQIEPCELPFPQRATPTRRKPWASRGKADVIPIMHCVPISVRKNFHSPIWLSSLTASTSLNSIKLLYLHSKHCFSPDWPCLLQLLYNSSSTTLQSTYLHSYTLIYIRRPLYAHCHTSPLISSTTYSAYSLTTYSHFYLPCLYISLPS